MNPKGRGIFKKAKPMNSFSVPSAEHDSGEPSHRFAWGRIARQPSEHIASGWLARTYDQFAEKFIDDLEYACIAAFAAVPVGLSTGVALMTGEPYWMLMIPLCGTAFYITAMQGVTMMRDKITERDERIAEINDSALWRLCESRREQIDKLMSEISHLEQDVAHWKAVSFTARGGVKEAAAGELSRSENKEASAAVLEFQNPKGAA